HCSLDAGSHLDNCGVAGLTFNAPIGRVVLTLAVPVVLAVGFVVTLRVTHHVGKREAVVRSDIVDGGPRAASVTIEQIARPREPCGQFRALAGIAAPEPARAVAKPIIPFGETGRVVAQLIAARTEIPRLGYELPPLQDRILAQRSEEGRSGI